MASQLMSSLPSFKKFLRVLSDISRSESLNSYRTLKPKGPYFLLSWITAWKKTTLYKHCSHSFLRLGQAFKVSSWSYLKDLEILGFMPLGGSRVILSAFWRIFVGK